MTGHLRNILKRSNNVDLKNLVDNGLTLFLLPSLNPDGVKLKRRLSYPGVDLNRQFHQGGYQAQEAFYLQKLINQEIRAKNLEVVLAIDYHCCANSLIKPAGIQPNHKNFKYYKEILALGKQFLSREIKMGKTKDFFSKSNLGTLKDFWHQKFDAISLTFEAPSLDPSSQILENHEQWLYSTIRAVLK